jgi:hypothetical protein
MKTEGKKMKIEGGLLYRQYSCIDERSFQEMVALCAYFKYVSRGFTPGYALQDWLEAEQEVGKRCFYWTQDVD